VTSGNFISFPIQQIWLDRDKRQRSSLPAIEELMDSIRKVGLINPLTIKKDGELIAGERRLTALKGLGWTHAPVQLAEDLPEDEFHLIELEENVRRVDLDWKDQCRAIEEYHRLRKREEGWTIAKTADALGLSPQHVQERLAVAKEVLAGNARVVDAPKYSVARGITARDAERRKASALAGITATEEEAGVPETPGVIAPSVPPILTASFIEWLETYEGPTFNLIHCDFPYGVNADEHHQGAAATHGGYQDTFKVYSELMDTLWMGMDKIVDPSAHLIFWFSMTHYEFTFQKLTAMGWKVDPFPLIWYRSDNSGILPDPNRGPRRGYETAFFASRGDRKIVSAVNNCYPHANTKTYHMSEKPVPVLSHFFRMVCDDVSRLLDPTCGSGNALIAARRANAANTLGLEINPEYADRARENWNANAGSNDL
jgi:ParB/RepB/Spo0J family partition protein